MPQLVHLASAVASLSLLLARRFAKCSDDGPSPVPFPHLLCTLTLPGRQHLPLVLCEPKGRDCTEVPDPPHPHHISGSSSWAGDLAVGGRQGLRELQAVCQVCAQAYALRQIARKCPRAFLPSPPPPPPPQYNCQY